jgi:hypothetical protein
MDRKNSRHHRHASPRLASGHLGGLAAFALLPAAVSGIVACLLTFRIFLNLFFPFWMVDSFP